MVEEATYSKPKHMEMLAEISGGIFVKVDRQGFIEDASAGLNTLGIHVRGLLIRPHLADLGTSNFSHAIRSYCSAVVNGECTEQDIEFAARMVDDKIECTHQRGTDGGQEQLRWFSLRLKATTDDAGKCSGAVGILRCIQLRKSLEFQLLETAKTDRMTGLEIQAAFQARLEQERSKGIFGLLAVIEVDNLQSFRLQFGPIAADKMIAAFAQFLRTMCRRRSFVTRIEGAKFAMYIPCSDTGQGMQCVHNVINTFAKFSDGIFKTQRAVSASAGVAIADGPLEELQWQAEKALVLARAAGGTRVKLSEQHPRAELEREYV